MKEAVLQRRRKRKKDRDDVPDLDEIEGVEIIPGPDSPTMIMGYARVSTAEQNLDMQVAALEKAGCEDIYKEVVSAASDKRPQLEKVLRRIRAGDTLTIWKLDRLARSLPDLLKKVAHIEGRGGRLRSLTESIDTSTPGGRLLFHVLGALAQFERDLLIERTASGMKAARERGVQIGALPMFTKTQGREMQKLRNKGVSVRQIAEQFECSIGTVQNYTARPPNRRK